MYYVCTYCKSKFAKVNPPAWLCRCGKPLSVHYNWEGKEYDLEIKMDDYSLWRYRSALPKVDERITLGEGFTPLLPLSSLSLIHI